MAGSNFHQLQFKQGECIRYNTKRGETERLDCTPSWARKEKINLAMVGQMKKLGMRTDNLDVLPELE